MAYTLKKLDIKDMEIIKAFFVDIFTKEPWNDDWSDENQLDAYLTERCGAFNSLTFGYFDNDEMIISDEHYSAVMNTMGMTFLKIEQEIIASLFYS